MQCKTILWIPGVARAIGEDCVVVFLLPSLVHCLQWSPTGHGDFCSHCFCNLCFSGMFLCVVLKSSVYLFPIIPVVISLNLFRGCSGLKGLLGFWAGGGCYSEHGGYRRE